MPKIRQAFAVFAAAAFCIGFNTYRYPVVSEMVAAVSSPAPSAETDATPKADAAEKTHRRGNASQPAAKKKPDGVVCRDGVCTMPLPESPTASLSSTPPGDSTDFASEQAEDELSRSVDPDDGEESKSIEPEEGEPLSRLANESDLDSTDETSTHETDDPPAESAEHDASAISEPRSTPAYGAAEAPYGRKPGTRLVSRSSGGAVPKTSPEDSPSAKVPLIPIVRPGARAKGLGAAEAEAASVLGIYGEQEPRKVRRLPAVDSTTNADRPGVTPDLAHTYPVTSAR